VTFAHISPPTSRPATLRAVNARWFRGALVTALGLTALGCATAGAAGEADMRVLIVGRAYQPSQLTVGLGQTVVWRDESFGQHTVTSVDGLFNSGVMSSGSSFTMTFAKAGTFDYVCTIHPTMKGSVIVLPIAPGTLALHLSTRRRSHGETLVVHVQAARGGVGVLLQSAGPAGHWQTTVRSHLSSVGVATLSLTSPAHRRLRVVVAAADGAPRLVSRVVRSPV
jgi:plastocyanin